MQIPCWNLTWAPYLYSREKGATREDWASPVKHLASVFSNTKIKRCFRKLDRTSKDWTASVSNKLGSDNSQWGHRGVVGAQALEHSGIYWSGDAKSKECQKWTTGDKTVAGNKLVSAHLDVFIFCFLILFFRKEKNDSFTTLTNSCSINNEIKGEYITKST